MNYCRLFQQVMSHSGGGQAAADRTPFYGIKLPVEVKKLIQLSKVVERTTMKQILKGTIIICDQAIIIIDTSLV